MTDHDPYCPQQDEAHPSSAHSFSEAYLTARLLGSYGQWIAVSLADGKTSGTEYASRPAAVGALFPYEDNYAYVQVKPVNMTVCEAASVLRFHRFAATAQRPDREHTNGGLEVIPRLTIAGRERQISAMRGQLLRPIAMGRSN